MKGFRVAYLHLIPPSQALLGTMFTTEAGNGNSLNAVGAAHLRALEGTPKAGFGPEKYLCRWVVLQLARGDKGGTAGRAGGRR